MAFDSTQDAYKAFRSIATERTHRIIAWCGAGLSAPAELPSWDGLRATLQNALKAKAETLSGEDALEVFSAAAKTEKIYNNWAAFERLETGLGESSFAAIIRHELRTAVSATIPRAYLDLWRLRIAGVLNLNLDRLATRAWAELSPGRAVTEFNSRAVGSFTHVLNSPDPFIYNVHGEMGDRASWVFTYENLKALLDSPAYINFIQSVLSTSTVLFVGISADDIASGGHLDRLHGKGIHTGPHFWITDRADLATDRWAESVGIRVIRYRSKGEDHSELEELFDDLFSYIPPEDASAPPVLPPVDSSPGAPLPDPDELAREDPETIRIKLNRIATEILSEDTPEAYERYAKLMHDYDFAVHRAWYTTTTPPRNTLLGFTLEREAARGAFGQVFHAFRPTGEEVAIKLLLDQIRKDRGLLQSFRRGVKSMRILSESRVRGMVPYHEASEIPAFVVMEWIHGANLKEAVDARQLDEWQDRLKVAADLADIIRTAHGLPERVLHRDLRPANVMLEGLWEGDWRVMVLDFDLSWHRGAFEHSVAHGTGIAGYWAPEQIERRKGVSTRHGAVDSFGLGMTLYYILTGRDPIPEQHQHGNWSEAVMAAASATPCKPWRSLPTRFARMILNATRDLQHERWDMSQIAGEATRLREALLNPELVESTDMIAEEIAERSDAFGPYRWDMNTNTATATVAVERNLELKGNDSERRVYAKLGWEDTGVSDRRRVGRWTATAATAAADILRSGGWTVQSSNAGGLAIGISAYLTSEQARGNLDRASRTLDRAAQQLSFS